MHESYRRDRIIPAFDAEKEAERNYTPDDYDAVKKHWEDYPVVYDDGPKSVLMRESAAKINGVTLRMCPFKKLRGSIIAMQNKDMTRGAGVTNFPGVPLYNYPLAILLRIMAKMIISADGKDYFVLPFRIKDTRAIPGSERPITVQGFLIQLIMTDYYLANGSLSAIERRLNAASAATFVFKGCGANSHGWVPIDVLGETVVGIEKWTAGYFNGAIYGAKRMEVMSVLRKATQIEKEAPARRKAESASGVGMCTGRIRNVSRWD
jgi:hypothetical protein